MTKVEEVNALRMAVVTFDSEMTNEGKALAFLQGLEGVNIVQEYD